MTRKLIMPIALLLAVIVQCLLTPAGVRAQEAVVVIVNKDNPVQRLSESDIRKIYTNYILNWPDGAPIILYDLTLQNPLRFMFSDRIFDRTPERIAEDWAHLKISNQAKNPPLTVKSEALILRRVAAERGAIGYVSLNAARQNPDVKIVSTIQ
ncbi:MAG: substrate-binding domain-containing protein [Deltaproteobacteria bacterium]|nr:substrate-binding domain-containing protein [Deltaproteobacteria bacterium]